MLGEALASRFEFASQAAEDKLGRHISGRRLSDGQPVVLTVLDPQLKVGPAEVAAAIETSRKLAPRGAAGILHCIEAGRTEGGNIYLLCESTPAETLKSLLRTRNGLTPGEALAVAYRIAAVLGEAAEAGVSHLDLSSSCIHVDTSGGAPVVRVGRYGFSRLLPAFAPTKKNEPHHGTAEYMAPEVCSGRPGDASADLYSLGILMYEMVAGKPPFVSSSPSTTIKRQVYEKPLPLHLVKPGTAKLETFEKIVARLLSKDPKGRPASAGEVMQVLAALQAEAFPEASIEIEPARGAAPQIEFLLEAEMQAPAAAAPMPDLGGTSHETMVFTGLAEATAALAGRQAAAAAGAQAPSPDATAAFEVSRPTEAFDTSMVAEAVKRAEESKAAAAATTIAVDRSEEKTVVVPAVQAPAPAPAEAPAAEGATGPIKKPEDWFVEGGHLPESALPEEHEDKRESRMFWVVALALGILLLFFGVVYWEATQGGTDKEPEVKAAAPAAEVAKEPAAPAPAPAVKPAPAPAPVPAPSPEQMKADRIKGMVARGKDEFSKGNLVLAKRLAEDVLIDDAANADAKGLLAAVDAQIKDDEAKAAAKAAADAAAAAAARKAAERPAPRPAPAPAPRIERAAPPPRVAKPAEPPPPVDQDRLKGFIKSGRDAYNKGDFPAAIKSYNAALSMDPNNALVQKLLEQAKAKAGQ